MNHDKEREITSLFNEQYQVNAERARLPVGREGASHEFDLFVRGKLIGGISTSPWRNKTSKGTTNTGGQDRVSTELLWLTLWEGKEQRVVILTDKEMADKILQRWSGCPFYHQIEIIHYDESKKLFEPVGVVGQSL